MACGVLHLTLGYGRSAARFFCWMRLYCRQMTMSSCGLHRAMHVPVRWFSVRCGERMARACMACVLRLARVMRCRLRCGRCDLPCAMGAVIHAWHGRLCGICHGLVGRAPIGLGGRQARRGGHGHMLQAGRGGLRIAGLCTCTCTCGCRRMVYVGSWALRVRGAGHQADEQAQGQAASQLARASLGAQGEGRRSAHEHLLRRSGEVGTAQACGRINGS